MAWDRRTPKPFGAGEGKSELGITRRRCPSRIPAKFPQANGSLRCLISTQTNIDLGFESAMNGTFAGNFLQLRTLFRR